jgi:hypothetical protein
VDRFRLRTALTLERSDLSPDVISLLAGKAGSQLLLIAMVMAKRAQVSGKARR